MTVRVVLAEDNALLRHGLVRLIEAADDLTLLGSAPDLPTLMALIDEHAPDVVVTDIRMPPTHSDEGIAVAAQLRTSRPETGVLLLSQYGEAKDALTLLEGLVAANRAKPSELDALPPRELEVLGQMAQGESNASVSSSGASGAGSGCAPSSIARSIPRPPRGRAARP